MAGLGRFVVYMLASRKYGAIYIGVTGNLAQRIYIHREALLTGFSSRYKTYRLVYFEPHSDPQRDHARKADQEVESRVEDSAHRREQP